MLLQQKATYWSRAKADLQRDIREREGGKRERERGRKTERMREKEIGRRDDGIQTDSEAG